VTTIPKCTTNLYFRSVPHDRVDPTRHGHGTSRSIHTNQSYIHVLAVSHQYCALVSTLHLCRTKDINHVANKIFANVQPRQCRDSISAGTHVPRLESFTTNTCPRYYVHQVRMASHSIKTKGFYNFPFRRSPAIMMIWALCPIHIVRTSIQMCRHTPNMYCNDTLDMGAFPALLAIGLLPSDLP